MLLHQQSQAVPIPGHFSPVQAMSAPKPHNACDECRTRKLKCSGEPTGCARCAQDGVTCRYSPRKQMGRPRKRRREEEPGPQGSQYDPWSYTNETEDPGSNFTGQERSMAFPDTLNPQLDMSGCFSIAGLGLNTPSFDMSPNFASVPYTNDTFEGTSASPMGGSSNELIPNSLQYGTPESTDYASWVPASQSDRPLSRPNRSFPHLQTPAPSEHTTITNTIAAPSSRSAQTCGCITTLYQTLSSFSSTPEAFFPYGISTLKRVTSTAWQALRCDNCAQSSYANCLQNSSALHTLINLIITEYSKVLKEIEERSRTEDQIQFRMAEMNAPETQNQNLHTGTIDCPMGITIDLTGPEWRTLARNAVRKEMFGQRAGDECIAKLVDETKERQIRWHNTCAMEHGRQEHVMQLNENGEANGFECTGMLYVKRLREMVDNLGL